MRLPTITIAGRPWALRHGLWPVANDMRTPLLGRVVFIVLLGP